MAILDNDFTNWPQTTTGTGSVTLANSGERVQCDADGASAALVRKSFFCLEGDSVEVTVYARRISSASATDGGQFRIDWYNAGTEAIIKDIEILSSAWKKYKLKMNRRKGDGYGNILSIGLGVNTAKNCNIEFTEPTLSVNGSVINSPRLIELFTIDYEGGGGSPRFKPATQRLNAGSVSMDGGGFTTIVPSKVFQYRATVGVDSSSRDVFPSLSITHERYGDTSEVLPLYFTNVDGDTGSTLLRAIKSDGSYISVPIQLLQHRYTFAYSV